MLYPDLTTALGILAKQYDQQGTYTFVNAPNFLTYLPRIIEYGEGRCYREITPLATRLSTATQRTARGLRGIALTSFVPTPVVVEGIALITPVGSAPTQGRRWQYNMVSIDFIDSIWPVEGTTLGPAAADPELYWAFLDAQTIVIAPTPDDNYTVEATGIFRPTPLSATNPASYLSLFYPDVFVAACMISVAGLQMNYGAQSDDPRMAISWEDQYEKLKASAIEEEQRRKGLGAGATPLPPAPEARQRRA